ncbi:hypothetical protein C6501_06865 [Candidatus Poribacteria bacterium]|nr:MAG: hypothetical protein C6501_06865 [Candidatus Poribacteria bacterium]
MKLIKAKFENFRLLRDLELDFTTNNEKKLTVVRAENESGKTTILNALQWGLYGDAALPDTGNGYRLSPIDSKIVDDGFVPISVEIEFEKTTFKKTRNGDLIETSENYRIIRSAYEILSGTEHSRKSENVKLYQLTDIGSQAIDPPEAWIHKELPLELREIFFTDGDRALSFIEASANTRVKRERVQGAIRSLLGLEVIENALGHVQNTVTEYYKDAEKTISNEKIVKNNAKLKKIDEELIMLQKKRDDAKLQFEELVESLSKIERKIEHALRKGDREKLAKDFEQIQTQIKHTDSERTEVCKQHSQLYENLSLSRELLAPVLQKSIKMLSDLRDEGKLPASTIPILKERLIKKICICGESLNSDDSENIHRISHIRKLIEDSRKPDALQNTLSSLYFSSDPLLPKKISDPDHWTSEYAKIATQRDELEKKRLELGKELKALEVQLAAIPNTNIQELRSEKEKRTTQRDRFNADNVKFQTQIEGLEKERRSLTATLNNLLRNQRKGKGTLAKLEMAKDVETILNNSYDRLINEELNKVSALMNDLFLEMIGADPEQGSTIRKAEISKEFDILVYGPKNRELNPDQDLNGASRRALTLAFILALTKVSGIRAPNVIDTPLGMMAGFVKKSVLKTAIRESSQLILFLTSSEITDCEEILDTEAQKVITLINTTHYPEMLLNNPNKDAPEVMKCECDDLGECKICIRRTDVENNIILNEVESGTTIQ